MKKLSQLSWNQFFTESFFNSSYQMLYPFDFTKNRTFLTGEGGYLSYNFSNHRLPLSHEIICGWNQRTIFFDNSISNAFSPTLNLWQKLHQLDRTQESILNYMPLTKKHKYLFPFLKKKREKEIRSKKGHHFHFHILLILMYIHLYSAHLLCT